METRLLRALAGGLCLLLATFGCERKMAQDKAAANLEVRVSHPVVKDVTDYEYFTGRTGAKDSVDIRARVTGYLVKMPFKEGADVKKDELLFEVDPRPYQATLDSQNGQVKLNEAKLQLAKADYARAKEISKTPGAISQQDLDKYAASQAEADAAVAAAKANAESARLNVEFTKVISPIDGQVSRYLLTLGNLVTQDQTLLTTVVSVDPMYAYFDVDERTMLRVQTLIREGKVKSARESNDIPVDVGLSNEADERGYPLYPHVGRINFVNNQIDPSTGTLQVRGTFDNPQPTAKVNGVEKPQGPRLLAPGMFVRVRFPVGSAHKSLLVPQSAIGTDQGQQYLLLVDDKNIVEKRPVTLGSQQPGGLQVVEPVAVVRTDDGFRAAVEGEKGEPSIAAADTIIVSGLQRVRSGATVTPKPVGER